MLKAETFAPLCVFLPAENRTHAKKPLPCYSCLNISPSLQSSEAAQTHIYKQATQTQTKPLRFPEATTAFTVAGFTELANERARLYQSNSQTAKSSSAVVGAPSITSAVMINPCKQSARSRGEEDRKNATLLPLRSPQESC